MLRLQRDAMQVHNNLSEMKEILPDSAIIFLNRAKINEIAESIDELNQIIDSFYQWTAKFICVTGGIVSLFSVAVAFTVVCNRLDWRLLPIEISGMLVSIGIVCGIKGINLLHDAGVTSESEIVTRLDLMNMKKKGYVFLIVGLLGFFGGNSLMAYAQTNRNDWYGFFGGLALALGFVFSSMVGLKGFKKLQLRQAELTPEEERRIERVQNRPISVAHHSIEYYTRTVLPSLIGDLQAKRDYWVRSGRCRSAFFNSSAVQISTQCSELVFDYLDADIELRDNQRWIDRFRRVHR